MITNTAYAHGQPQNMMPLAPFHGWQMQENLHKIYSTIIIMLTFIMCLLLQNKNTGAVQKYK